MRLLMITTIILVLTGSVFAQEQAVDQTEELDIVAIEQKAKADAKFDFKLSKKFAWAFSPIVPGILINITHINGLVEWTQYIDYLFAGAISVPSASSLFLKVNLTEEREASLSSLDKEYQSAYRVKYKFEIKKRRLIYSLIGVPLATIFWPIRYCSNDRFGCGSGNL